MTNVVKGNFGKPKASVSPGDSDAFDDELMGMLRRLASRRGSDSFLICKVWPLCDYLNGLRGYVPQSNIDLRKQEMQKSSDEELKEAVNSSSELDWSARPAYYWALIQIIENRKSIK